MSVAALTHHDDQTERIVSRLRHLARLMDAKFTLPGTSFRFGLDGLIGLIPGVGDTVGALVSAYIILEARRLGASNWTMVRMAGNVLLEWIVGSIPLIGDLFDFAFKANLRNLRLLGISA